MKLIVLLMMVSLTNANEKYIRVKVNIEDDHILHTINGQFLSVALDSGIIQRRWEHLDFRSRMLKILCRGLAPSKLRIGGTGADFLIFDPSAVHTSHPTVHLPLDGYGLHQFNIEHRNYTNFTMTGNSNAYIYKNKGYTSGFYGEELFTMVDLIINIVKIHIKPKPPKSIK